MESPNDPPEKLDPTASNGPQRAAQPLVKDGGIRAWSTLIGGFLTFIATFGYVNAFGVYQDRYTRSHAASASGVSWIGSTQLFLLIVMGFPAGKLLDMGYFRQTNLVGSVIYTFSLFMLSLAHPDKYYQIFLSQGIGMGVGGGLLYVPAMGIQAHHWRQRRPLAVGVVIAGSSIGGIIFPIMLNQLFEGHAGFSWGVRASAFVVSGLLIPANILMTDNPAITSSSRPKPNIKSLILDGPYMFLVAGALCVIAGVFFPYFYLQIFAILHGVNSTAAFYSLAIISAAAIPGRTFPNMFVNRLGVFNLLIPVCFICGALNFALFGVTSVGSMIVFAILYGFFSGALWSLVTVAAASMSQHESEVGLRMGLAYSISALGALVGNPIDGVLLGENFRWFKAIIFSGVTIFGGTFFLIVARQLLVKSRGTQFV